MSITKTILAHCTLTQAHRDLLEAPPTDPAVWAAAGEQVHATHNRFTVVSGLSLLAFWEVSTEVPPEGLMKGVSKALWWVNHEGLKPLLEGVYGHLDHLDPERAAHVERLLLHSLASECTSRPEGCDQVPDALRIPLREALLALIRPEVRGRENIRIIQPDVGIRLYMCGAITAAIALFGDEPIPAWLLGVLRADLEERSHTGLFDSQGEVENMRHLPSDEREVLLLRQKTFVLKLACAYASDAVVHHMLSVHLRTDNSNRSHWNFKISGDPTPWIKAIIALFPSIPDKARHFYFDGVKKLISPENLPLVIPCLESPDRDLQTRAQGLFFSLGFAKTHEVVERAFFEAATTGRKRALARVVAHWGLCEGRVDPIEAMIARETDEEGLRALQLALTRARPDWPQLAQSMGKWPDGPSEVEDPQRREELDAIGAIGLKAAYNAHEPMVLLACLERAWLGHRESDFRHNIGWSSPPFDAFEAEISRAIFSHRPLKGLQNFYKSLDKDNILDDTHHVRVLQEMTGAAQRIALRHVARRGNEALPTLFEMLGHKKAAARTGAALTLAQIGAHEALGPLRERLAIERASKVKATIEAAIKACDPAEIAFAQARHGSLGTYRRGTLPTVAEGLEALREILYEPPTQLSWVKLCDLLQRLHHADALQPALDYLSGHGIERWPEEDRPIPWGWDDIQGLSALGTARGTRWIPVSVLHTPQRDTFIAETLLAIEKKNHHRCLPVHLVEDFTRWIDVAWAWCETHGVDLSILHIRLDGGAYKGMSRPGCTILEVWRHFGVRLYRDKAHSGFSAPQGMRWVRVDLPRDHPLRDRFSAKIGARYLELMDALSIEA